VGGKGGKKGEGKGTTAHPPREKNEKRTSCFHYQEQKRVLNVYRESGKGGKVAVGLQKGGRKRKESLDFRSKGERKVIPHRFKKKRRENCRPFYRRRKKEEKGKKANCCGRDWGKQEKREPHNK